MMVDFDTDVNGDIEAEPANVLFVPLLKVPSEAL
jgi:hypothetical protein